MLEAHSSVLAEKVLRSPTSKVELTKSFAVLSKRLLRLRCERAASDLRSALWKFLDQKAGFRPTQPRWPKGSGEAGGRWSGGDSFIELVGGRRGRPKGHHVVNRATINSAEFNLSDAAKKVFESETTGPLYDARHFYDLPHREYNEAVAEELRLFLRERRLAGNQMTERDAEDFITKIYRSKEPRIERYNRDLFRRLFIQLLNRRFGPFSSE